MTSGLVNLPWGVKFAPIMQWASARPYSAKEGVDYFGVGNGTTTDFAVLLNSAPTNYQATAGYTATQLQSCLAASNCHISSFDALRGSPFFQLDAREQGFPLWGKDEPGVHVPDVQLDESGELRWDYQGNIRSSTFGTPVGFITPSSVILPQAFTGEAGFTLRF